MSQTSYIVLVNIPKNYEIDITNDELINYTCKKSLYELICYMDNEGIENIKDINFSFINSVRESLNIIKKKGYFFAPSEWHAKLNVILPLEILYRLCVIKDMKLCKIEIDGNDNIIININSFITNSIIKK